MSNYKLSSKNLFRGFTIVELLVTMSIFATLVGIATINLVGAKQRTVLNTSIDILIGDIRQQQIKAMLGDTEGRSSSDKYGIHFSTTSYTLFHGSSYNSSEATNFTIQLGDNCQFFNSPSDIIFDRVNGEVAAAGSVVLRDNTTKTQKTVQYNLYGVITSVN
jgi:prepilin-type N-terminal cleavage/methylation domain-containing protein